MSSSNPPASSDAADQAPLQRTREAWQQLPFWLRKVGLRCWLYLGIVVFAGFILALLSAISGLVVPFVIAVVAAALFNPIVDALQKIRIPRALASALVLMLLTAILTATMWIIAVGVLNNWPELIAQAKAGFRALEHWAKDASLPAGAVKSVTDSIMTELPQLASGFAASFGSGLTRTFSVFIGVFAAVFLLYFLLYDWHGFASWMGRHLGVPEDVGREIVSDATAAVREYFYALTLSSIVVSLAIWAAMILLDLPLALPIGLVTMVTSYVPYLGAIFSGAFAVLIALGAGGWQKMVIVLGVVIVMQNIVQTVIQNQLASDRLKMHPILTFSSVIAGGLLFGVLGAMLANPVAALMLSVREKLRTNPRILGGNDEN